jgi:hypothetical protein
MMDTYVLFMPYSLSINSPWALLSLLFCGTDEHDLKGQIPIEMQTISCDLRECRAFSLLLPLCITLAGFFSYACHRDYPYCRLQLL